MRVEAFGVTDIGKERTENQDALLIDEKLGLFIVCDGMGGHAAGRAASELGVSTIHATIRSATRESATLASGNATHFELLDVASKAIESACAAIYEKATSDFRYAGMGCTTTLLLVSGEKAAMAHVGDSALYLCRDEATERLNILHTYAGEMIRGGALTPDAAKASRFSNVLSRAVGAHQTVTSDKLILDLLPGDTFLLCSDGITRYLESDEELTSFLIEEDVSHAPEQLVGLANSRGGHDNSTALVVRAVQSSTDSERLVNHETTLRAEVKGIRAGKVFQDITLANALRISAFAKTRVCEANEVLSKESEPLRSVFLVLSGSLSLLKGGVEVCTLGPSDAAGLRALFGLPNTRYLIRAREHSVVLELNSHELLDLARRRPWFGMEVLTRAGATMLK